MIKEQWEFLKCVAKLIRFIESTGWTATGGELYRTKYQQDEYYRQGKTKTHNSQHILRLAIDLHIFFEGELIEDVEKLKPIGNYWQMLSKKNIAGMFWKFRDVPHFERRLDETNDKINNVGKDN